MANTLDQEQLARFLRDGGWKRAFDEGAASHGSRLAKARLASGISASLLDTGDAEISGTVAEKGGDSHHATVAFWSEDGEIACDATCTCSVSTCCAHAAALLEHLAKGGGERLAAALGGKPHADRMTRGQTLGSGPSPAGPEPASPPAPGSPPPRFCLRVERRPPGERSAWLPEIYAQAHAVYGSAAAPLAPSGVLSPLVSPGGKTPRDRAAESEALRQLYALDLQPGAEDPPASLRKLSPAPAEGTLWAPDSRKWPHADFYWQRFRHEGAPALERRGWEIRYAPEVGLEPLVFRTETWRAEMVEEGRGWFRLSAGFEIGGEAFDLQPILAALVANRFLEATAGMPDGQEFLVFLPDGRGLALPVGRFRRILERLGDLIDFRFSSGPLKLAAVDAAQLAATPDLDASLPDALQTLAERLSGFPGIEPVAPPGGLRAELRPYQVEGYRWMQFLARHGLHGILADDMGLGKTLQTLAHLLAEKESGRDQGLPSLVIAPTSVVANWQREAEKFAPGLSTLLLQGPDRAARFARVPRVDLALTSYALVSRDLEALARHRFHLLVLDEAQQVKNPSAQASRAVRRIDAAARLCLSGTPVENHLGELWSLMDFLMPGMLGGREAFAERYRGPIERDGNAARSAELARRVGPLILRRTKDEVAPELPPKTEIIHPVELNEAQKDLYETVRSTMDKQVRQALALQGQEARVVFLDALLKLRQICCHPKLLGWDGPDPGSAKFDRLTEMLDTLREEGRRTLVFSQFTSMLEIIAGHLYSLGRPFLKLTGATSGRQELVERFQSGEGEVFLISLKAGGTGLTLTGADTVVHYDPWWNPAAENQASDRAYRIGQDKPVFIHKLVCQGTVEERILRMQDKKGGLASGLLSGATRRLDLSAAVIDQLLAPLDCPDP